ncbi:DUF427 domain-containing protein [Pusillimonas noertemannii]|uniref:DUF427 domain-containing protein n=1 Tax=Pusillimonas noertemannii TaxID=305977 RepID=UPI00333E1B8C
MNQQSTRHSASDHPIVIHRHRARVTVRVGSQIVADTCKALTVHEATLPLALYIPREDVNMALLERSIHRTHCPYKGDAHYYSTFADGTWLDNVAWTYETPLPQVAQIKGHLSFYPDRIDEIIEEPFA